MGFFRFKSPQFLAAVALAATASGCVSPSGENGKSKMLSEGSSAAPDVVVAPLTVPNNVAPAGDVGVSKVVAGLQHACAIRSGSLSCWGLNKHGQIGNGSSGVVAGQPDSMTGSAYTVKVALTPYEVFSRDVSDVALGYEHTCAIKGEELFCWGSNEFGQLGLGSTNIGVNPRPVSILRDVKQVAARGRWTCAVVGESLVCFGTRLVKVDASQVPKLISSTPKVVIASGVQSVSLSTNHGCVVRTSGALECFGANAMGEVGNGLSDGADVSTPFQVLASGVSSVSVTDSRSCAVVGSMIKCFGASLGDREIDRLAGAWRAPTPTAYDAVFWNGIGPGLEVSASGTVLSSAGELFYGSFFHGSGAAQKVALGVSNFGYSETDSVGCMMFRNHAVKCWGSNLFGQLGTGSRSKEELTIFKARDVQF
jgi:alpha-tubulin suppressor-like RCC1 family protein